MSTPIIALEGVKKSAPLLVGLFKFLLVVACVAGLTYAAKQVYDDQVAIRDKVISEATARAAAEAREQQLNVVIKAQDARARELAQELEQANLAMRQISSDFASIKRNQQALQAQIKGMAADLQSKPPAEVAAKAQQQLDAINKQLEDLYP